MPVCGEQLHHPLRRARDEARATLGQEAGAGRGQAVDVLGRIDRRDHLVLVDLVGQRQLDEDPVDRVVRVQLGDQLEQLVLAGVSAPSPWWIERIPTSSSGLRLLPT